jgi:uncharacterized protein (TIGR02001 family)
MRKAILFSLAVLAAPVVLAEDTPAEEKSPHAFTANVSISTDYRFRGITQTTNDPAISGGLDYAYSGAPVGIFLGVWASNIDFAENTTFAADPVQDTADLEMDFYGGLTGTLPIGSGLGWKIGGLYYMYPGSDTDGISGASPRAHYDYVEAYGALSYNFGIFNVAGGANYSPDYFFESGDGLYYYGDLGIPLPMDFALSGHVGHQDIDNNPQFGTPDYTDWNVGISKTWKMFTLKLSYVDTDLSKSECFGGTDFCDATGVFSITASY